MIDHVPNEILIQIFNHLPPQSLHNAAVVCNHWSRIAKTLGVCQLNFCRYEHQQLININNVLAHIQKTIPTDDDAANIRHILVLSDRLLPNTVFDFIQRRCPNVISFDYDPNVLDPTNTKSIARKKRHSFYASNWRQSIAHLPACQRENQVWSNDIELCLRLETLYIRDGDSLLEHVKPGYCIPRLPYLPQLKTLTLHSAFKFKESTINRIHYRCFRLTALTLCDTSLTCIARRSVQFAVTDLTDLILDNVHFLNYESYNYFPHKYPNIQTLTLSSHIGVTFDARIVRKRIYRMIIGFNQLKKLVVHVKGMSDKDDRWLQRNLQTYFSHPSTVHVDWNITFA